MRCSYGGLVRGGYDEFIIVVLAFLNVLGYCALGRPGCPAIEEAHETKAKATVKKPFHSEGYKRAIARLKTMQSAGWLDPVKGHKSNKPVMAQETANRMQFKGVSKAHIQEAWVNALKVVPKRAYHLCPIQKL
jgi:hypothetical protein